MWTPLTRCQPSRCSSLRGETAMKWTGRSNGNPINRKAQAVWPWTLKSTHKEAKITKKQLHSLSNISKDIRWNIIQNPQIRISKGAFPLSKFLKPHRYSRASFTTKPRIFFPFPEPWSFLFSFLPALATEFNSASLSVSRKESLFFRRRKDRWNQAGTQ